LYLFPSRVFPLAARLRGGAGSAMIPEAGSAAGTERIALLERRY